MLNEHNLEVLPLRRALVERPLEGKRANDSEAIHYKLLSDYDDFTKVYHPNSPYKFALRNDRFRGFDKEGNPILVNIQEHRQKDEFSPEKLQDYLSNPRNEHQVKIGNCLCRSIWCAKCHKLFYVPKYKERINQFDYTRTRHVILTTDRTLFSDNIEALGTITEKKELSAFIRKLEKGKKVKEGSNWVWEYQPIEISKVLAVLEFYEDGFPHWHLLIEVKDQNKDGMIGGKTLHWAWKYGIVRETYFRNQNHWNNIAGYFADKGYFEKGKEFQTALPENIKEHFNRRIRRITYYNHEKDLKNRTIHNEEQLDITEEEALEECSKYFADKKQEQEKEKTFTGYKTVLAKCGSKTFIRTSAHGTIFEMILPVPFQQIKELINPEYQPEQGYICKMPLNAILFLKKISDHCSTRQDYSYDGFIKDEDWQEDIEEELEDEKRTLSQQELPIELSR